MTIACTHEKLIEGYYGHDCAACGELVYPHGCAPWDDDEDYSWTEYDDGETDEYYDCGWVRGVGCTLAGTEECDFECPFRDDNHKGLRLTKARLAERAAVVTDTPQLRPGARVVCPGGVAGTVEAISARPNARWPILVKRDDGQSRSYAVAELTRLRNPMMEPYP